MSDRMTYNGVEYYRLNVPILVNADMHLSLEGLLRPVDCPRGAFICLQTHNGSYWRPVEAKPLIGTDPRPEFATEECKPDKVDEELICNIRGCLSGACWNAHSLGFLCHVHASSMLKEKKSISSVADAQEITALGRMVSQLKKQLKVIARHRDEYQRELIRLKKAISKL